MSTPSCLNCRFFVTRDQDTRAVDLKPADDADQATCLQGYCRRNPPAPGRFRGEDQDIEYDYGQWPLVLSNDWCGAFESCRSSHPTINTPTPHVRPCHAPESKWHHQAITSTNATCANVGDPPSSPHGASLAVGNWASEGGGMH